jgi:hypothetical protein
MHRLLPALTCLLLLGCQATSGNPLQPGSSSSPSPGSALSKPAFTPGPAYAISHDSSEFLKSEAPNCDFDFQNKTSYLGGLTRLPIAACVRNVPKDQPTEPTWLQTRSSFFLGTFHTVYLVREAPQQIKELSTLAQLQSYFMPIESPEEALSLLLATQSRVELITAETLPQPASGETYQGARYKVQKLEGTRIEKQGEDFLIKNILLNGSCLADGQDTTAYSASYLIKRSGEIQAREKTEIYTFGRCPIE